MYDNRTNAFLQNIHDWQNETFPNATTASKLHHLHREVSELIVELCREPKDERQIDSEFADCFFLLFGAAYKEGFDLDKILLIMAAKFEVNRNRKWGKPDENGVVEHIKHDAK